MDALLRRLARAGLRHGMAGEHWAWFVLALAAFALRRARRSGEDVVTVPLRRGERLLVSLSDPRAAGVGSGGAGGAGDGASGDRGGMPGPAGAAHS